MTDIATISALPIGAFFPEGRLPLHYRDDKPIITVNGVEHDAEDLLRRFAPVWADESKALHWIDRYAAGIDAEPQMDRILECAALQERQP